MTVVNRTTKSIGIIWSNLTNQLNGGVRFYVALARKTNGSEVFYGKLVTQNTTSLEITGLDIYTEYNIGVVVVNDDGAPFKSADILAMSDEQGE